MMSTVATNAVSILCWIIVTMVTIVYTSGTPCDPVDPEELVTLQQNLTKINSRMHWSFWLVPSFRASLAGYQQWAESPTFQNTQIGSVRGHNCPDMENLTTPMDCSPEYVIQHDPFRIPENLLHAQCRCTSRCAGTWIRPCFSCRSVHTYTWVYRRTDCRFVPVLEAIPISCRSRSNVILAAPAP